MKIGIVTPMFHPYPGGVTEHVDSLRGVLAELGHEVKVVTTSFGNGSDRADPGVIRIGRSVPLLANGSICPVPVSPRMAERARTILARERFDLLHVHEPFMPMLCLAFVKAADVPVVATFHASNEAAVGYRLFRKALAPYDAKISRRIAVSEAARRSVEPFFAGEYTVIPNGVSVARFSSAEPFPSADGPSFRILFVGRMEPRKGAKYLLQALPEIAPRVPSFHLTVVGGGPLAWYYRAFVPPGFRQHVSFEGRVTQEALSRHYASADVFCSPATGGESFGIVLLEAMAARAAIVASDIPGYRGVIEHGSTGLLVEPRSPSAIARAISDVCLDRDLRERLIRNAAARVLSYSWERVAGRIVEVFEDALAERAAPGVRPQLVGRARDGQRAEATDDDYRVS